MASLYCINGTAFVITDTFAGYVVGDDANNGLTPLTPKASLSNLLSTYPALTNADTINLSGLHVGTHSTLANIQRWDGQPLWQICGSIDISAGGTGLWTRTGNTWRKTIGPGVTLGHNAGGNVTALANLGGGATQVTTDAAHGLSNGRYVTLAGLTVAPGTINGRQLVTVLSATTFSVAVDSSGSITDQTGTWNSDYGNACANWMSRTDSQGRHFGWYLTIQSAGGTLAGNDLSVDQTYACDGTTFWIRDDTLLPAGVNPGTLTGLDAVRYVPGGVSRIGLNVQQAGAVSVSGGQFLHYCTRVGVSYGFLGGGVCTLRDCTAYDCGDHAYLFSRNPNTASRAINCTAWGSDIITSASFTWHNPTGGAGNDVTGAEAIDCFVHAYPILAPNGLEHDNAQATFSLRTNIGGFFSHTSPGGGLVKGITYTRCVTKFYSNPGTHIDSNDTNTLTGGVTLSTSYPIVATDCYQINAKNMAITGRIFFRRGTYATSGQTDILNNVSIQSEVAFEACVLSGNIQPTAAEGRNLIRLTTGAQLTLINCACIVIAAGTNFQLLFAFTNPGVAFASGTAGWRVTAHGTIFAFNGTAGDEHFMAFDDAAPAGNYVFVGCDYFNIPHFSDNDTINGVNGIDAFNTGGTNGLGWRGSVDTTAINVDPSFTTPGSFTHGIAGYLGAASVLKQAANRLNTATHASRGINQRPWNRLVGAWQDGGGNAQGSLGSGGSMAILMFLELI